MRSLAAALMIVTFASPAVAETWPQPRTTSFVADWQAARAALATTPYPNRDSLADMTALASEHFPAIALSPIPVLLPYAIGDDAYDRATDATNTLEAYTFGFQPTRFFHAGPTGYDATFLLRTRDLSAFADIGFKDPVAVQISGFNLLYDLPEAKGATIQPPGEIAKHFPGVRKQILEHTLRYSFERFGIPYMVSIQCFDGPQRRTRLACRNAERIAVRFMQALRVAGGNPSSAVSAIPAPAVERPQAKSDAFRYQPVGKLVPGTGMRAPAGNADPTVYARMRFPGAAAPAYVNTQTFRRRGGLAIAWAASAPGVEETKSYTWRDNFCEKRDFAVGQCPSGRGHQGQDILGVTCEPGPRKRDCPANRDDVVAAREGMILREAWNDSFFLVANAPGERMRFRHLHMHPRKLDDDGILSGRIVKEGERLGTIGNYNRRPGMTTTHLHFEIQVPTRDGWVRVNPYMTLIASYEHLIGARGSEVTPAPEPAPDIASATPQDQGSAEPAVAATAASTLTAVAAKTEASPEARGPGKTKAKPDTETKPKAKSRNRAKARPGTSARPRVAQLRARGKSRR